MAGTRQMRYFQEPLFEELRKYYCYVCGKKIKGDDGVYIGNNTWRHKKCKPGSVQWLKSPLSRDTTLTDVLKS
jgi:hypothetical protein